MTNMEVFYFTFLAVFLAVSLIVIIHDLCCMLVEQYEEHEYEQVSHGQFISDTFEEFVSKNK